MKNHDDACRDIRQYSNMIYSSKGISCWCFNLAGGLFYSTCPKQETFLEHLRYSGCLDYACTNPQNPYYPTLLSDHAGFLWVADYLWDNEMPDLLLLMGPFLLEPCDYKDVKQHIDCLDEPVKVKIHLRKDMVNVPVVGLAVIEEYAVMLHFSLTDEHISKKDVQMQSEMKPIAETEEDEQMSMRRYEQAHFNEQQLLQAVREGNLNYQELFESQSDDGMTEYYAKRTDLRSEKNTVIIFTALCSRAAIEGGLTPSIAKRMENRYIDQMEACTTTTQLMTVNNHMLEDFVHKVYEGKQTKNVSGAVRNCQDYIQQNLTREIHLEDLARETGYSEYYLTKKFSRETGVKLHDYIKDARIERAKIWLATTSKSIEEISEQMQFGTRNYFSKIFKDKVGMSPVAYRESHR